MITGLHVTMPYPRGKKSTPAIYSRTDDFPDDCDPITIIVGKFIFELKPI